MPDTKKLSGIRSQEVDGSGFNQLRFDDTTGQISVQLQSSHGASQLNLGNLSHPKEQATSDGRGEGFELRTDQWGAMRAGKGLLISTYAQDQAVADHLAAAEAQSLLKQGHDSMQVLSQVAEKQQTDALNVLSRLPKFIESLEIKNTQQAQSFIEGYAQALESSSSQTQQEQGKLFRQALMLLASPNGIALTTPEDILLHASQEIAQSSQANINLSAQKNIVAHAQSKISLFAAEQGLKAFAGKGKLELQAQDDLIEIIAKKVIKLIATEEKIELTSSKEIDLKAGGTQLLVNGSGVFIKTGGKFESKAGQHVFTSGEKVSYEVPTLPNTPLFSNRLDVYDLFWESDFSQLSYKAFLPESNSFTSGQIDEHGRTGKISTADASKVKVLIGSNDDWGLSIDGFDEEDFDDGQDTEESGTDSNNLEEETENNE